MEVFARLCKCTSMPVYFMSCRALPSMGVFCLCRDCLLAQLRSWVLRPGLGKPLCPTESLNQVCSKALLKELCCNFFSAHDAQSEPAGILCRGRLDESEAGFYGHFFAPTILWMCDCCWFPVCTGPSLELYYPSVYGNACWNVVLDEICLRTSTQSTKKFN